MVRHLSAGKQTYHLSVSLLLDESFGSCLMPSRADINVDSCHVDQLIRQHCSSKPTTIDTSSTVSATEVVRIVSCCLTCMHMQPLHAGVVEPFS